jgi:hypothetical protein
MKAFPNGMITDDRGVVVSSQPGMDLRDYFAAKAMQQFMPMVSDDPRILMRLDFDIANLSYQMADAMMKARA